MSDHDCAYNVLSTSTDLMPPAGYRVFCGAVIQVSHSLLNQA